VPCHSWVPWLIPDQTDSHQTADRYKKGNCPHLMLRPISYQYSEQRKEENMI